MVALNTTPGPWQVNGSHVYGPDPARKVVCQTLSGDGRLLADRNLIAAAPNLYEALELVAKRCGPRSQDGAIALAALAKARGEA